MWAAKSARPGTESAWEAYVLETVLNITGLMVWALNCTQIADAILLSSQIIGILNLTETNEPAPSIGVISESLFACLVLMSLFDGHHANMGLYNVGSKIT